MVSCSFVHLCCVMTPRTNSVSNGLLVPKAWELDRVAHQLSNTITRTQPFLSDQTELAILATFSTSEGVTQQACTVPASAEGQ